MKYARVTIDSELLMALLTKGPIIHLKVLNGLPKGTKLRYITSNQVLSIDIIVEHESFKSLSDGEEIPILNSPSFYTL
jgi:hypothetical protein